MHRFLASFFFCLFSATIACAQNGTRATAQAQPDTLMVGDAGTYMIRVLAGEQLPNLNTPRVDGLDFSDVPNQSNFTQIINGRVTRETRLSWEFRPIRPGTFTIPGRTITIDGDAVRLPDVSVTAVPLSEERKTRHFIELNLPEGPYFVGQAIPSVLKTAIRSDIDLSGIALPDRSGDAFLHSEFSKNPPRNRERISGRSYETFTWDILVTPIKSGTHTLTFSQQIGVQVAVQNNRFPSFFNQTRTESVTLTTDNTPFTILEVPAEGRPDAYRDAIGSFEVTASLSSRELVVGEPITMTLFVRGSGNFDRITAPTVPESDDWRLYPPKVTFTADDDLGHTGTKSFEYILIPRSESITEVPGISFAWFNPAEQDFYTTHIDPEPVTVEPSPINVIQPVITANGSDQGNAGRRSASLRPILPTVGNVLPLDYRPVQHWTVILSGATASLAFILFAAWTQISWMRSRDPLYDRRQRYSKSLSAALAAVQSASQQAEPGAFFENTLLAIKLRTVQLDPAASSDPRSLVADDVIRIVKKFGGDEQLIEDISYLFQAADAFQFAGSQPRQATLEGDRNALKHIIDRMGQLK